MRVKIATRRLLHNNTEFRRSTVSFIREGNEIDSGYHVYPNQFRVQLIGKSIECGCLSCSTSHAINQLNALGVLTISDHPCYTRTSLIYVKYDTEDLSSRYPLCTNAPVCNLLKSLLQIATDNCFRFSPFPAPNKQFIQNKPNIEARGQAQTRRAPKALSHETIRLFEYRLMDARAEAWAQNFRLATSTGPDSDQARAWMNEHIWEDPFANLRVFVQLLRSNEDGPVKQMAVIGINMILNYTDERSLRTIRQKWSDEVSGEMRALVQNTLLCENEVLRKLAGRTFALLYGIEGVKWNPLPAIQGLLNRYLEQQQAVPLQGLLNAFMELLFLPNLGEHWSKPEELQRVVAIAKIVMQMLSSPQTPVELRILCITCMEGCFDKYPAIYKMESEEQTVGLLKQIVASLQGPIQMMNHPTFLACHKLMFGMVSAFYELSDRFMEHVYNWTSGVFEFSGHQYDPYKESSLFFWQKLCELEAKIEAKDMSKSKHLVRTSFGSLRPKLFEMMTSGDNPEAEEDTNDIVSTATLTLRAFFNADPECVFAGVKDEITSLMTSSKWNEREGAILAMWALTSEEEWDSSAVQGLVGPYAREYIIPTLVNCIQQKLEIVRLRQRAVLALGAILEQYKPFICRREVMPAEHAALVNQLVPLLDERETDLKLLMYLGRLDCAIVSLLGGLPLGAHSPITRHIDRLIHFAEFVYHQESRASGDVQLSIMTDGAERLANVIRNIPGGLGKLRTIYQGALDELRNSMRSTEPDNVRFVRQGTICTILTSIILRWNRSSNTQSEVTTDVIHETLETLCHLASHGSAMIMNEVFYTMDSIVRWDGRNEQIRIDYIQRMTEMAHRGLTTESPEIIGGACMLIHDLFKTRGNVVMDVFMRVWDTLFQLWMAHEQQEQIHSWILLAMAGMLSSITRETQESIDKETIKGQCRQIISMAVKHNYSRLQSDANQLYEFLCRLMNNYLLVFASPLKGIDVSTIPPAVKSEEKETLMIISEISNRILALPKPTTSVLVAFVHLEHVVSMLCSRANNTIANKRAIHEVLNRAKSSSLPALAQEARKVAEALGRC